MSVHDVSLRSMVPEDWPGVRRVYQEGIETGHATFEQIAPEWGPWNASKRPDCRIVAVLDGEVVGFAALSPTSTRPVYEGVCEVMVYVSVAARRGGVGRRLLERLVVESEEAGIWTLQAGIFPENEASLRLHRGSGFRQIGTRERIGRFADGRWRDVVILERRSSTVGS